MLPSPVLTRPGSVGRPAADPSAALRQAARHRDEHLATFARWVAVPSVSGDARRRDDVLRAGTLLAALLRKAGGRVRMLPVPGAPPLVVGRVAGQPGAPTLLVYGHVDVVPPGPGWTQDAFRPVLRNGRMVGRGTNDDKGPLLAVVAALDAWHRAGGMPATVWVVAEGAEEVGSPGLAAGLATVARRVRPDAVLACDTERTPDGVPSLTVSQRGHLDLRLAVDACGRPVHPGRLGGAVADPTRVLAGLLGRLPAALADVAARAPAPRGHPRLRGRDDEQVAGQAGGRALAGPGLDRRITLQPALSVLSMAADAGGRAVPRTAAATLDVRLPPTTDAAATTRALRRAVVSSAPAGVRVDLVVRSAHDGAENLPSPDALAAVDDACRATVGRPVRLVRSGGSLPAAGILARTFRRPPLLLGLATSGGRAHGPDEFLDVADWAGGIDLLVRLLAAPPGPGPPRTTRSRNPRATFL